MSAYLIFPKVDLRTATCMYFKLMYITSESVSRRSQEPGAKGQGQSLTFVKKRRRCPLLHFLGLAFAQRPREGFDAFGIC